MNILNALFGSTSGMVNAHEAKAQIESQDPPYVLDVRQLDEYKAGHIAGAKLIPLDRLESRLHELPRDREILCVCRSGSRSGVATRQLAKAGFKATNLRGGMINWQLAGYPVKKGN